MGRSAHLPQLSNSGEYVFMANRRFSKVAHQALERAVVHLYARVSFGSSGAPTLSAPDSIGVKSIARNSAGDYTVTFQDNYLRFLHAKHAFNSGSSAPAAPGMWIKAESVTSGTIEVVFNAAGTATDPASGEIVYLTFELRNTSVSY